MGRDLRAPLIGEAPLVIVAATAVLFWVFGARWFSSFAHLPFLGLAAWLFVVILLAAFAVARHADALADQLGEPLGTLVLTLSVSVVTFSSGRTNVLQGAVHLVPFLATYVVMVFD